MDKIYYTVEQANKILPKIKPLIGKLMDLHLKISLQNSIGIEYEEPFMEMRQSVREAKEWHTGHAEYFTVLDKLASLGIFVKDPSIGLIDFYSINKNQEIFLCYKYPEQTVQFWHEIDSGFQGRQSIRLLEKTH